MECCRSMIGRVVVVFDPSTVDGSHKDEDERNQATPHGIAHKENKKFMIEGTNRISNPGAKVIKLDFRFRTEKQSSEKC